MNALELDTRITKALRDAGHRVTLPRLMVHRHVAATPQHVTAEDIRAELPSLSLGTVYSTLDLFEELGLVRRVSTLEGAAVYDSRPDLHAHAVCRRCGKLFDLDQPGMPQTAAPAGFRVERVELQLVGVCAGCAQR
jgi:Fe2+ or Zn2+ uptake regulation protein